MFKKFNKIKKTIENEFDNILDMDYLDFIKCKSYEIIKLSGLFDEEFYLSHYIDVKLNGYDPIEHYLNLGVFENCNPNKQFNTKTYLNKYPNLNPKLINPLVHYILYGFFEKDVDNDLINLLEKNFFVSIIMVGGDNKDIVHSVNSVLNQSFKNFELIIATPSEINLYDDSLKYRLDYHDAINKIKCEVITDSNISQIRNNLLDKSKGNIIAYLDSNSLWASNFLEEMLFSLYTNKEFNCAYSNVLNIDYSVCSEHIFKDEFDRKSLLDQNFINLNSFVHHKRLYEIFGGFDVNLSKLTDWDLIIRYTDNNPPVHVNKTYINYYTCSPHENIDNFEEEKNLILNKIWTEKYEFEYDCIKDEFDQGYYLGQYDDVLKSNMHPMFHFLYKGYKENKNPNVEFNMKWYRDNHSIDFYKNDINPFIHYIGEKNEEKLSVDYNNQYGHIIDSNSLYLSDYSFSIEPLVSIIVLNNRGLFYLEKLFNDFKLKTNYMNYEIIVVDNELDDNSKNYIKSFDEHINFISVDDNLSFSKCNNYAVNVAKGEYILFIDSAIELTYGWLNELMGTIMLDSQFGAIGAKLLYSLFSEYVESKYQLSVCHVGQSILEKKDDIEPYQIYNVNEFSQNIFDSHISKNKECFSISKMLLTKKDLFKSLGGFNEQFNQDFSYVDYNLRLYAKNFKVVLASAALGFYHGKAHIDYSNDDYLMFDEIWGKFLFKRLLFDKISKNFFFTDKKLKFTICLTFDFKKNEIIKRSIHKLISDLNYHGYEVNINFNWDNLDIDEDVDVLISFSDEYCVDNVNARKNLIKILILEEFISIKNTDWDILGITNEDSFERFKDEYSEFPLFYISNSMELSKEIISMLMKIY